jgi:hypothetical protein
MTAGAVSCWCGFPRDKRASAPHAYREGDGQEGVSCARTASGNGRWSGLSRVRGNLLARFLGGGEGAIPPCYPELPMRKRTNRVAWELVVLLTAMLLVGVGAALHHFYHFSAMPLDQGWVLGYRELDVHPIPVEHVGPSRCFTLGRMAVVWCRRLN